MAWCLFHVDLLLFAYRPTTSMCTAQDWVNVHAYLSCLVRHEPTGDLVCGSMVACAVCRLHLHLEHLLFPHRLHLAHLQQPGQYLTMQAFQYCAWACRLSAFSRLHAHTCAKYNLAGQPQRAGPAGVQSTVERASRLLRVSEIKAASRRVLPRCT